MMKIIKDVQAALSGGNQIRVHGNGFLQLDLNTNTRLHVWGDPRIPHQKVDTPIHDHVFTFESTIIKGALQNNVYDICEGASYQLYSARYRQGQDTVLVPYEDGRTCDIKLDSSTVLHWGTTYWMKHGVFHESLPYNNEVAVSVMTRTPAIITDRTAIVLVPLGQTPDNEFNRHGFEQRFLLKILGDALQL